MAVAKNILVQIFKVDAAVPMFVSTVYGTLEFAPEFVGKLMTFVTGFELEDDDHGLLNNLHTMGHCGFKFGNDWEYYVKAKVEYPE